jgi:hypothetical protein
MPTAGMNSRSNRKQKLQNPSERETDQDTILEIRLDQIRPSPQNDKLYRPIDPEDPRNIELVQDIRKNGLLQPIGITLDNEIFDGHRRHAAAKIAGLKTVPVRRRNILSTDPEFTKLLVSCNLQREKSLDERLREEIVSASPDEAYQDLLVHRAQAANIEVQEVELSAKRARAVITNVKQQMFDAAYKIIQDNRRFWPFSVRAIHYRMADAKPLRHSSKPDSEYRNDQTSYKSLIDLLARARLSGLLPMEAIADETRPVTTWNVFRTPGQFLGNEIDRFSKGYWRDLMQSQPNHVELLVEKNTVEPILTNVASRYTIPMTSGRGFCSLPPRAQMMKRFKASGKERLILVVASDFDPEGESICESFARSMRDDFDCDITAVKAALTFEQTQTLTLPPALEVKDEKNSGRAPGFIAKYGRDVYELEALTPEKLQELVDEAIRSVIDIDLFNSELEAEKTDSAWIDLNRRKLLAAMSEISLGES